MERIWKESAPGDETMALAELGDMVVEHAEDLVRSLVGDQRSRAEQLHASAPLRRMALALLDVTDDAKRRRLILLEAVEIASDRLKKSGFRRGASDVEDGRDLAMAVVDLRRCLAMFYPDLAAKLNVDKALAAVLAWGTRMARWAPVAELAASLGATASIETLQQDWSRHRHGDRFFRRLPCWSDGSA